MKSWFSRRIAVLSTRRADVLKRFRTHIAVSLAAGFAVAGCGTQDSLTTGSPPAQPAARMVAATAQNQTGSSENILYLTLKYGRVTIKLRPDLAPKHVERLKKLTREGFYNGLIFHRVINNFMAQTGDPTGTGGSGSKYPDLRAEFSRLPFTRGIVGMARASSENSANSQFFIMFGDALSLNGLYTIVGEVVDGMKYVDMIARGEPPRKPDLLINMQVAADVK